MNMRSDSQIVRIELSNWQKKMLRDLFGVDTDTLDFLKEMHELLRYAPPIPEKIPDFHIQRMYLEDAQKDQIAESIGVKSSELCDYLELDHEKIVKYMALNRFLYGPARKND